MSSRRSLLVLVLALMTSLAHAADGAATSVRRFALVIGVNDGGPERVALKFATTDAETFARVMEELGGIAPEDTRVLLNPDRRALLNGVNELKEMIARARLPGRRLEAIVYYSGHSDENGLLVAGELVEYRELRAAMADLPADVRIAVVDSCASGALTRIKGGQRRPSFLVDSSTQLKGHAFLTSSSATEAAQESDRIGASYFTHFLVSGLRGAADVSGDGRVTLTEAYQFAFNETLAKTENSRGGAQHPNYDFDLSGSGDLVMTDLRSTSASLVLGEPLSGRFYVRDESGRLVVELYKVGDRTVELGLSPGDYQVTRDDRGSLSKASLVLTQGGKVSLNDSAFTHLDGEPTRARGDVPGEEVASAEETEPALSTPTTSRHTDGGHEEPAGYDISYASFELLPGLSNQKNRKVLKHFALSLLGDLADRRDGVAISSGVNITTEAAHGVEIAAGANLNRGTIAGAQVAGGVNVAKGGGHGVMVAGGANLAGGALNGVQVAGGANVAGEGAFRGTQVAGGVNILAGEAVAIAAVAGGANFARGGVRGLQVAGGLNVAGGPSSGLQLAGGVNIAKGMEGLQLAVVNVSGDLSGAQVGVVNVAAGAVSGTQVGVVNVAGEYTTGVPVGLLSFVKDASYHAELWTSELAPLNLGLRMDVTPHAYTLLAASYTPGRDGAALQALGRSHARAQVEVGLGGVVPLGDGFGLRFDGLVGNSWVGDSRGHFNDAENDLVVQLRAGADFAIASHLGLFAGFELTTYQTWQSGRNTATFAASFPNRVVTTADYSLRYWPGFFGGVHF